MTYWGVMNRIRRTDRIHHWGFEGSEKQILAKLLSLKCNKSFRTNDNGYNMERDGERIYVFVTGNSKQEIIGIEENNFMILIEKEMSPLIRERIISELTGYKEIKMIAKKGE